MSPATRLLLIRLSFVALCLGPTALVFAWSLSERKTHYSPDELDQARSLIAADLAERLGLKVSLQAVSYPEANVTLLEGVELADPETGRVIAKAGHIELALNDRGLAILASQVELQAENLTELWDPIHDRLLRSRTPLEHNIRLAASQATLRDGDESLTLTDVAFSVRPAQQSAEATLEFHLAGLDMPEPARLQILRNRQTTPPQTRWTLHTGAVPLPCSFFARHVPWLASLGESCHLHGALWATKTSRGWEGEMTGRLSRVDLERLLEPFPHTLRGEAEIYLSRLRLEQGRLTELAGWLAVGPGVVSRSLLDAASAESGLRLVPGDRLRSSDGALLRYRQMAFGFTLDGNGVSLVGQCEHAPPGAILADDRGVLLHESPAQVLPTLGLVRTLVPESETLAPLTRETSFLLQTLAMPAADATTTASRKTPHRSVRLKQP